MTSRTPPLPPCRRQRGFSMIEALIAAALIGVVAIGVIPMFTRAMSDNMAGSDYTRVSNYARSDEEDFSREPFSNYTTAVTGTGTTGQIVEYIDPVSKLWVQVATLAQVPKNPNIVWTRTTTYRQYGAKDMDDDQVFDYPLAGGTTAAAVHLMEATVQVQSISALGPAGAHRSTTIRYLKAF